ncbi:MAG TPA: divergent PAP2 family protein [Flexilinea sp.]|nr:divergent PAP2 family protein [Flexilinea sp.]
MFLTEFFGNPAVVSGLAAMMLAQLLKLLLNYALNKKWDWVLLIESGGMPSSHSAMVTAIAVSIGLWEGFDTAAFAAAFGLMVIVTYDSANVRWQSGLHAQKINQLLRDVFSGQPINDQLLKEVIGHTPRQVYIGVILGILVALAIDSLWV